MSIAQEGKGGAAGVDHFGFDGFEHRKISPFAAQIVLHPVAIASKDIIFSHG
jgi:hypothetical protein